MSHELYESWVKVCGCSCCKVCVVLQQFSGLKLCISVKIWFGRCHEDVYALCPAPADVYIFIYMCVYVCMYTYTCMCVYMYTYMCVYIYTYIYIYICIWEFACIFPKVCWGIYMYIHTQIYIYACIRCRVKALVFELHVLKFYVCVM